MMMSFAGRFRAWFVAMICLGAVSSLAMGADHFSLVIGPHDVLAVFGPNGARVPGVVLPSIGVPVTVGGVSFQVSYGRAPDQRLMAIISPSSTAPTSLHFHVCGTRVDCSKNAVVTLTFAPDLSSVVVDPGYIGRVDVNSRRVRRDAMGSNTLSPQ
jgi:hypothetical protein